jgi:hypothetical protein
MGSSPIGGTMKSPHTLPVIVILICMLVSFPAWPLSLQTVLMAIAGYIAGRMDQKYYARKPSETDYPGSN